MTVDVVADAQREVPSRSTLLEIYRLMSTITTCDDRSQREVRNATLRAAFYPVHGLEGVCGPLGTLLTRNDYMVATYRNLADVIAKGVPLRRVVAEAYGKIDGTSKGKGGPMHLAEVSAGLMATSGVVGGGLPIATGLGLANLLDGGDSITVATFGDGATSIGAFHEALGLAALWKAPVLFLCQNNGWGEHTALAEYAPNQRLSEKAASYDVPGVSIDGFDPIAVWQQLSVVVRELRARRGPILVEARTYRLTPHSAAGDASYMPKDELDAALQRDPTPTFRRRLVDEFSIDAGELDEIDARIASEVDDAFAFALQSPPPGMEELYTDLFEDEVVA